MQWLACVEGIRQLHRKKLYSALAYHMLRPKHFWTMHPACMIVHVWKSHHDDQPPLYVQHTPGFTRCMMTSCPWHMSWSLWRIQWRISPYTLRTSKTLWTHSLCVLHLDPQVHHPAGQKGCDGIDDGIEISFDIMPLINELRGWCVSIGIFHIRILCHVFVYPSSYAIERTGIIKNRMPENGLFTFTGRKERADHIVALIRMYANKGYIGLSEEKQSIKKHWGEEQIQHLHPLEPRKRLRQNAPLFSGIKKFWPVLVHGHGEKITFYYMVLSMYLAERRGFEPLIRFKSRITV